MGGAVAGRRVYGEYPVLIPDNALDVGRGRYIPTTSVDAFYAELALWFGIAPADLDTVLPNIRRFYSPGVAHPTGRLHGLTAGQESREAEDAGLRISTRTMSRLASEN